MLTSTLIEKVKNTAGTPDYQSRFSNQDILNLADDELNTYIVPMLLAARSEFLVVQEDFTLTSNTIQIPYRSVANGVRDIYLIEGSNKFDIPYLSPEDQLDNIYNSNSTIYGFYFQGDEIVFLPENIVNKTVRVKYHMGVSNLSAINGGKITNINRNTGAISINIVPTGLSTSEPIDLIDGNTGMIIAHDINIVSLISTNVTISTADIPSRLKVGDYLFLKEKTPIIPIPREVNNLLVLRTAAAILASLGDSEAEQKMQQRIAEATKSVKSILDPRSRGGSKVLKSSGLLNNKNRRTMRYY